MPAIPQISFDYGTSSRNISMPTIVTSSESGTIRVYDSTETLVDSFSIIANTPYKYNPPVSLNGSFIKFKLFDGSTESNESTTVQYSLISSFAPVVANSPISLGNTVTINVPAWDNSAPNSPCGEGLTISVKPLGGAKTQIFSNVVNGQSYQWTPPTTNSNWRIYLEYQGVLGGLGTRVIVTAPVNPSFFFAGMSFQQS